MLLDFMNHQFISGNKLRKLEFHLDRFFQSGKQKIVSIGGYYSNHLTALAWVTEQLGIPSVGIINGNQPPFLGATLKFLLEHQMELRFVPKSEFKSTYEKMSVADYPDADSYFVPLGGRDVSGLFGFEKLVNNINNSISIHFDEWWISYGSGTSASAIAHYTQPSQRVFAQGAVKDSFEFLNFDQHKVVMPPDKILSQPDTVFGGIGKFNLDLLSTITEFRSKTGIPLDPIYTGKLVYYFKKKLEENLIGNNKNYLLIHTGGLQGIEGFNEMRKTNLSMEIEMSLLEPLIMAEV